MTNFLLVVIVFIIGFGWGAATMTIQVIKKLNSVIDWQMNCLLVLEKVMEEHEKVSENVKHTNDSAIGIIDATKNIVDSVDNLIKELGNEV